MHCFGRVNGTRGGSGSSEKGNALEEKIENLKPSLGRRKKYRCNNSFAPTSFFSTSSSFSSSFLRLSQRKLAALFEVRVISSSLSLSLSPHSLSRLLVPLPCTRRRKERKKGGSRREEIECRKKPGRQSVLPRTMFLLQSFPFPSPRLSSKK